MMNQENRTFSVGYYDPSLADSDRADVLFEMTEGAENALFSAFTDILHDSLRDGLFPAQKVHLFYRLTEQRELFPPWFESPDEIRTYDMVLSEYDYHILSTVVGAALKNILSPKAADKYAELLSVWVDITEQLMEGEIDVY